MPELRRIDRELHDRLRDDYSLDDSRPPEPPLSENDARWAAGLLAAG